MKYKKGTFVVVPNKDHLKGKPSEMQTIYFWLCDHADENGECFPSRSRIAKEAGCGIKTVDKYLKQLVDDEFLSIEQRKKSGTKENMSNLYTLCLKDTYPQKEPNPSVLLDPTPSVEKGAVTIPSINSTQLTTLPIERGKTPTGRLMSIYQTMFYHHYGFYDKSDFKRNCVILSGLLKSYSELQVARMLTIFFNWHGMTGSDDREFNFLSGATFALGLFKAGTSKYEAYIRNVLKEPFDDDKQTLTNVGKYILSLKEK